ncbi:MAG: hypothetical protein NTU61_04685, partial [Candidatus Altiarchaeota archaeon]|nr:hypothetical protein [Candidatus Altiarchaeota archaeon]
WKAFVDSHNSFEVLDYNTFTDRYGESAAIFDPMRNKMVFRAGLQGEQLNDAVREEVTHSLHFFLNPTLRETADSMRGEYNQVEAKRKEIISYFNRKNPFTEGVVEYLMDREAAERALKGLDGMSERDRVDFLSDPKNFGLAYIGAVRSDALKYGEDIADETVALKVFEMVPGLEKAGVVERGKPESWSDLALRAQRHGGEVVSSMLDEFSSLTGGKFKDSVQSVRESRVLETEYSTIEAAAAARMADATGDMETTERSLIGFNMPGGYTKSMQLATIRAFISQKGEFIADIATAKSSQEGSLYSLVTALRDMHRRTKGVEARGRFQQQFGGTQQTTPTEEQASVKQVAGYMDSILFGTMVDISPFKHFFLGYDPANPDDVRRFDQIFSEVPPDERARFRDEFIPGLIHRGNHRDKILEKKDRFKKVTVADAASLYLWAHEAGFEYTAGGEAHGVAGELNKTILRGVAGALQQSFNFVNTDGSTMGMGDVQKMLKNQYGLEFNSILSEDLGFMARDYSHRVHGQYVKITPRMPSKWIWLLPAEHKGIDDPATSDRADEAMAQAHKVHGDILIEMEGRRELDLPAGAPADAMPTSSYGRALAIAWHKGADDVDIQKGDIFGRGNPDWKFARCDFLAYEFLEDFRDHQAPTPTYENETEFQRRVADDLWKRMNNQGHLHYRDKFVQDFIEEGLPTLQDATMAYVKRRWGKDDEAGRGSRIRGYDMTMRQAGYNETTQEWLGLNDVIADDSELGRRLLARVNAQQQKNLRHVDEISRSDLTGEVIADSGMDEGVLTKSSL